MAKYATKSADPIGVLDHRIRHRRTIERLDLDDHQRRLVTTAWDLGDLPQLARLNLHAWAHTLGYRDHWLTKSRRWSTTFNDLRTARHHWQQVRHGQDPTQPTVGEWDYQGSGHTTSGDAWLASSAAHHRNQARRIAWEER